MLKYIFGALFIVGIWAGAFVVDVPAKTLVAGSLTAVIVLVLVVIGVAGRRREKQLKRELARPGSGAGPVREEFARAVEALRGSTFRGERGSHALDEVPWYVLLGPPGAGKSTLLRQCGLRFPYAESASSGARARGHSQWWMSNEAVIVETAGLYATVENVRKEWLAFLATLRKIRPRRPINGIVCTVAVTDLAGAHPDRVLAYARELRARFDELTKTLETVPPLYLVFTKCDLVPGFMELFADFGEVERRQLWGFTVPLSDSRAPHRVFGEWFVELCPSLERHMLVRLAHEGRRPAAVGIFAFPQHFDALYRPLTAFVESLLAKGTSAEPPRLRGAYFGSAERGYFLGDLFEHVVLQDRYIARDTRARRIREACVRFGAGGLLFLASVAATVASVQSFLVQRDLSRRVARAVAGVDADRSDDAAPMGTTVLGALRAAERSLGEQGSASRREIRIGMDQEYKYGDRLQRLWRVTLRDDVVRPLLRAETERLQQFAQRHSGLPQGIPLQEHKENTERLRLYLLLTGGSKDPTVFDRGQQAWLAEALLEAWSERLHEDQRSATAEVRRSWTAAYSDLLAQDPEHMAFERDADLARAVRAILERSPTR